MVEAGKGERERERENVRVCEGRKKKARLGFSREEEGRKEAIKQAEKRRGRYLSLLVFNRREEKERNKRNKMGMNKDYTNSYTCINQIKEE